MDEPTSQSDLHAPARAKLALKIQAIMAQVTSLPKNGWNDYFKFAYVRSVDAVDAVRTAAVEVKMVILSSMIDVQQTPVIEIEPNGSQVVKSYRWVVKKQYEFIDCETGHVHSVIHAGESSDTSDKGLSKASTSCDKYMLLSEFLIPSDVEPDGEVAQRIADSKNGRNTPRQASDAGSHGGGQHRNPVPAGKSAFGFVPNSWPHVKAFDEPATDPQIKAIEKRASELQLAGPELKALEGAILGAYQITKWSKGAASVVLDFLKGATEQQLQAAEEAAKVGKS